MEVILEFVILACLIISVNLEEKRWIWEDKKHDSKLARYEVVDDVDGRRPFNGGLLQKPSYNPRPSGVYGLKPAPSGGYGLVNHPYKPGGVITGPEPTWSQPRPLIKNFDKCKCTEKFNCPTPGLSYGNCDVGKSYCCYSTKAAPLLPNRPIHSAENGILVGPGGPIDYPKPIYNRPGIGYGLTNGVLTGPNARPPYYQQQQQQQNGGLGVPYSPGIRPRTPH